MAYYEEPRCAKTLSSSHFSTRHRCISSLTQAYRNDTWPSGLPNKKARLWGALTIALPLPRYTRSLKRRADMSSLVKGVEKEFVSAMGLAAPLRLESQQDDVAFAVIGR